MSLVSSRDFRQTVFRLLVDIYNELEVPDYVNTAQILVFLDDAKAIADILLNLIKGDEVSFSLVLAFLLLAFQAYHNHNRIVSSLPIKSLLTFMEVHLKRFLPT